MEENCNFQECVCVALGAEPTTCSVTQPKGVSMLIKMSEMGDESALVHITGIKR